MVSFPWTWVVSSLDDSLVRMSKLLTLRLYNQRSILGLVFISVLLFVK
jgi:hypothetical protein